MSKEEENDKGVFTRNPVVEQAAVEILGYREDQVKRLTIAQLERELGSARKSSPNSGKPKASVSFSEPVAPFSSRESSGQREASSKKSSPPSASTRKASTTNKKSTASKKSSATEDEHLAQLIKLYQRKVECMSELADDSDFDGDDLEDWAESIERARAACLQWEEQTRGRAERKARKIKQLHHDGLLDQVLQKKWLSTENK